MQERQDLGAASPAADSMQRDGPRGRLWIIDGPVLQERQNLGAAAAPRGALRRQCRALFKGSQLRIGGIRHVTFQIDMTSFRNFIYSDLHGSVVVHDRYQNYDAFGEVSHQLCCQHLLRDLKDAAESYPDAIWPGQVADALRGLIHQANLARDQGLASVPDEATAEHLRLFRNGVSVGLSQVRRIPGGTKVKQPPARMLLECLRDRQADVLRFLTDTAIPPTSNQAVIRSPIRVHAGRVSRPRRVQRGQCLTGRLRMPGQEKAKDGSEEEVMRQLGRSHNRPGR